MDKIKYKKLCISKKIGKGRVYKFKKIKGGYSNGIF